MCAYAGDILSGVLPGPYSDEDAAATRAPAWPAELLERADRDVERAAPGAACPPTTCAARAQHAQCGTPVMATDRTRWGGPHARATAQHAYVSLVTGVSDSGVRTPCQAQAARPPLGGPRLRLVTWLFRAAIKRLEFVNRAQARARSTGKVHSGLASARANAGLVDIDLGLQLAQQLGRERALAAHLREHVALGVERLDLGLGRLGAVIRVPAGGF